MVSVRLMTYNHANFIKSAMDGIMNQRTNFLVEVVVGDDFSNDETLKIIRSYSDTKYIKIKILNRSKGDEYWEKRQKFGRLYNFYNILENCRGKYIALLDGDDYWTDPYKLQKQVDILEENPSYSIVHHNVYIYDKNTFRIRHSRALKKVANIEDLILENKIVTLSCVFRNNFLTNKIPEWFTRIKIGDRAIHLFNAQFGLIYYIDEVMGVYRIHSSGIYNSSDGITRLENRLEAYNYFVEYFDNSYKRIFISQIYRYNIMLCLRFLLKKYDIKKALFHFIRAIKYIYKGRLNIVQVFYLFKKSSWYN